MASSVPGTQGVINMGGGQEDPAGKLMAIIQAVHSLKTQQHAEAQAKVDQLVKMSVNGMLGPEHAPELQKAMKDAGYGDIVNAIQPHTAGGIGGFIKKIGDAFKGNGQGAQSATQLPSNSGQQNPGGGVMPAPQGMAAVAQAGGADMEHNSIANWMQSNMEAYTAKHGEDAAYSALHKKIIEGTATDKEQLSYLVAGGHDVNMEHLMWNEQSPDNKKQILSIAAGNESPAQKETRLSTSADRLFATGQYKTLADARRMANGDTNVERLPDLGRLGQEAEMIDHLTNAGLSNDQARDVATKVGAGMALGEAMPKGVPTSLERTIELENKKIQLQKDSLQIQRDQLAQAKKEGDATAEYRLQELKVQDEHWKQEAKWHSDEIAANSAKALDILKNDKDKEANARLQTYVDMKRAGVSFDPSYDRMMQRDVATRSGMKITAVPNFFNFLTGGTHDVVSGDIEEDKGTLNNAIGAPQMPGSTSHFTPVLPPSIRIGGVDYDTTQPKKSFMDKTDAAALEHLAAAIRGKRGSK